MHAGRLAGGLGPCLRTVLILPILVRLLSVPVAAWQEFNFPVGIRF
jgi:hypothetical protein